MSQSGHDPSSSISSGGIHGRTGNSSLGKNRTRLRPNTDDDSNIHSNAHSGNRSSTHSTTHSNKHNSNNHSTFNSEPDDLIPSDMAIPSNTSNNPDHPPSGRSELGRSGNSEHTSNNPDHPPSGRSGLGWSGTSKSQNAESDKSGLSRSELSRSELSRSDFRDKLKEPTKGNRYRKNPRKLNLFKDRLPTSEMSGHDSTSSNRNKDESDSSDSDTFLSDNYSVTTNDILEEMSEIKAKINILNDHMTKMSRLIFEDYENTTRFNKNMNSRMSSLEKSSRSGQLNIIAMLEDFRKTSEQRHISVLSHLIVTSGVLFMKKDTNEVPGQFKEIPATMSDLVAISEASSPHQEMLGLASPGLANSDENEDKESPKPVSEDISSSQPIGKDLVKMLFDSLGADELRSLLEDKLAQVTPTNNVSEGNEETSSSCDKETDPTNSKNKAILERINGSGSDSDSDSGLDSDWTRPKRNE